MKYQKPSNLFQYFCHLYQLWSYSIILSNVESYMNICHFLIKQVFYHQICSLFFKMQKLLKYNPLWDLVNVITQDNYFVLFYCVLMLSIHCQRIRKSNFIYKYIKFICSENLLARWTSRGTDIVQIRWMPLINHIS